MTNYCHGTGHEPPSRPLPYRRRQLLPAHHSGLLATYLDELGVQLQRACGISDGKPVVFKPAHVHYEARSAQVLPRLMFQWLCGCGQPCWQAGFRVAASQVGSMIDTSRTLTLISAPKSPSHCSLHVGERSVRKVDGAVWVQFACASVRLDTRGVVLLCSQHKNTQHADLVTAWQASRELSRLCWPYL
jgi:hypothetical protein